MQKITSIDDAVALVGQELGVSGWKEIDQQRINDFADVTEDRQWIHTDVERANAESQYRSTIAHGNLTLSLIPAMSKDNYQITRKMTINYGLNKVRFLDAVTPGSRIRVRNCSTPRRLPRIPSTSYYDTRLRLTDTPNRPPS
jgi:acyl dehydratase